jgi:hypothetical protein
MTTILHKRGTGQPSPDELKVGEIAIDTLTGALYTKQSDGSVVEIGGSSGGGNVDVDTNIPILDSPPANPELGQQWFSSTDGYLYIWYGAEWVATNMKSSGGGDSGGDPNFGNVDFLLNGEDGLADSTGNHTVIVVGEVPIETNIVKYGSGSIGLSPQTAGHLAVESFGDLGGPFTVEAWVYPEGLLYSQIICHWRNADQGWTLTLLNDGTITSSISHNGSGVGGVMTSTDAMTAKQWHHVALTWDTSIYRIFLDGKMSSEVYVSSEPPFNPPTADLTMGARFMSSGVGQYLNGYMDDIRITKGLCRYTANFEPPEEHPVGLKRTVYLPAAPVETQEDSNDADLS